jgi:hypothetical protein
MLDDLKFILAETDEDELYELLDSDPYFMKDEEYYYYETNY